MCCVCCHPIYSGRQTCGRTGRGQTGFLHLPSAVLALIFLARRIQPFLSVVDREVEFCVPTNYLFSTCWAFSILFFLCGKIPVRVTAPRFELTSQRQKVSRLPKEPPGRPCNSNILYFEVVQDSFVIIYNALYYTILYYNDTTLVDTIAAQECKQKPKPVDWGVGDSPSFRSSRRPPTPAARLARTTSTTAPSTSSRLEKHAASNRRKSRHPTKKPWVNSSRNGRGCKRLQVSSSPRKRISEKWPLCAHDVTT